MSQARQDQIETEQRAREAIAKAKATALLRNKSVRRCKQGHVVSAATGSCPMCRQEVADRNAAAMPKPVTARRTATACRYGHPATPENTSKRTRVYADGTEYTVLTCKICDKEKKRRDALYNSKGRPSKIASNRVTRREKLARCEEIRDEILFMAPKVDLMTTFERMEWKARLARLVEESDRLCRESGRSFSI